MSQAGIIKEISGVVQAINSDGSVRVLVLGDSVYDGEIVVAVGANSSAKLSLNNGNELSLAGEEKTLLDESVVSSESFDNADVQAIQQALLEGSALPDEATAAGQDGADGAGGITEAYVAQMSDARGDVSSYNLGTQWDATSSPEEDQDGIDNQAPEAFDDVNEVDENTSVKGNVLDNDTDDGLPNPDADLDVVSVNGVTPDTDGNIIITTEFGTLTLNAETGDYEYSYFNDSLAVNETTLETFEYVVTDGDKSSTATLEVTLNGVNDAPIITSNTSEDTINTSDRFIGDGDSANVSDNWGNSYSQMDSNTITNDRIEQINGSEGQLNFQTIIGDYDDWDGARVYLYEGEVLTLTSNSGSSDYYLGIDDSDHSNGVADPITGAFKWDALSLTTQAGQSVSITASNDGWYYIGTGTQYGNGNTNYGYNTTITINGVDVTPVIEDVKLQATGTIEYIDADLSDTHDVSSTKKSTDYEKDMGTFRVFEVADTTGTGVGGEVTWVYDIDPVASQELAEGEIVREVYTVSIDDGNGGVATQDVAITIVGTNDIPTVEAHNDFSAIEDGDIVYGQVVANDIDNDDDSSTLSYAVVGDTPAGLVFNQDGSYSFDGSAYQSLGDGETKEVTFGWNATDSHGAQSLTDSVTVTITGTNDAPIVVSETTPRVVDEDSRWIKLDVLANDTDPDANDNNKNFEISEFSVDFVSSSVNTFNANDFNLDNLVRYKDKNDNKRDFLRFKPNGDFDKLATGEEIELKVNYTVQDDFGATTTGYALVTVVGTNDAPRARVDRMRAFENDSFTVDVLANDRDIDNNDDSSNFSLDSVGNFMIKDTNGDWISLDSNAMNVTISQDNKLEVDLGTHFDYLAQGDKANVRIYYNMSDDEGAGQSNSKNYVNLTIKGTNDAPEVLLADTTYTEVDGGRNWMMVDSNASVSDVDSDTFKSLSISIDNPDYSSTLLLTSTSAAFDAIDDGLKIVDQDGTEYTANTSGHIWWATGTSLTITKADGSNLTQAEVDTIMQAVKFSTGDRVPSDAHDIDVSFSVTDDFGAVGTSVSTIDIIGTNDTPVLKSTFEDSSATQVVVDEDNSVVIRDQVKLGFGYSDNDGDGVLTLSVENGILNIDMGSINNYTPYTVEGNGTSTVTITGLYHQTNGLLNGSNGSSITYSADADFYGNDTLHVDFNDNGDLGLSGTNNSIDISIGVDSVPDAKWSLDSADESALGVTVVGQLNSDFGTLKNSDTDNDGTDIGTVTSISMGGVDYHTQQAHLYNEGDGTGYLTSSGQAVVIAQNGMNIIGTIDGGTTEVFRVVVNAQGKLEFTQSEAIEHIESADEVLRLGFGYEVTDEDGDVVDGYFSIEINDDIPTFVNYQGVPQDGSRDSINMQESNIDGDTNVVTKDFRIDFGADGMGEIVFNAQTAPSWLESNGEAVVYTVSPDGSTLTASTSEGTVFTVAITDGSYSMTMLKAIDHIEPDQDGRGAKQSLSFSYTATDGDGDAIDGNVVVNVMDDIPTIESDTTSVNEDGIVYIDVLNNDSSGADGYANNPITITTNPINGVAEIVMHEGKLQIKYTPNDDYNGTNSIGYTITDNDGDVSDEATVDVTINAVNDAPINTIANFSGDEDSAIALDGVSISDIDAGSADVRTTFYVDSGTLSINNVANGASISGDGTGRIILRGTVAEINETLSNGDFKYQGDMDFNGTDSLRMVTTDLGNTGLGGTKSDSDTVSITVNSVNDAPELDLSNNVQTEIHYDKETAGYNNVLGVYELDSNGQPTNFEIILTGTNNHNNYGLVDTVDGNAQNINFFIIANGDYAGIESANLEFSNGQLLIDGVASSKPVYYSDASLNNGGRDHFHLSENADGDLQVNIEDLDFGDRDFSDIVLTLKEIGDTSTGYETTFVEAANGDAGTGMVAIASNDISITDVDDTNIESATVTLTNALDGDFLSADNMPTGITATVLGNVVTLNGSATLAEYQDAIKAISYGNTSENPNETDRVIEVVVNDGDDNSNTATTIVHVNAINDAPVVTVYGGDNLVINGGFEELDVTGSWGHYNSDSIPGWDAPNDIEIWDHVGSYTASEGQQNAELDYDGAIDSISQTLNLSQGKFLLKFDAATRDASSKDNDFNVLWNGVVIATITESEMQSGDGVWDTFTFEVDALNGDNTLTFVELTSDNHGVLLDNIRLYGEIDSIDISDNAQSGDVLGYVATSDVDGNVVSITTNDSRFEVVDGVLVVKESGPYDDGVDYEADINLVIGATDDGTPQPAQTGTTTLILNQIDDAALVSLVQDDVVNEIKTIDMTSANFDDGFRFEADIFLEEGSNTFFRQQDDGSDSFLIEFGTVGFHNGLGNYIQVYIPTENGIYRYEGDTPLSYDEWSHIEVSYTPTDGATITINGTEMGQSFSDGTHGVMKTVVDSDYVLGDTDKETFDGQVTNVTIDTLADGVQIFNSGDETLSIFDIDGGILNLSNITNAQSLDNIELSGKAELSLSAQEVFDVTDGDHDLTITGIGKVLLDTDNDSNTDKWTDTGNNDTDGNSIYTAVYTDTNSIDHTLTIHVDDTLI